MQIMCTWMMLRYVYTDDALLGSPTKATWMQAVRSTAVLRVMQSSSLALQRYPSPQLVLTYLKHNLDAHEQCRTCRDQEYEA